jgi:hypothetical protein
MDSIVDQHMVTVVLRRDPMGFGITIGGYNPVRVIRITESKSNCSKFIFVLPHVDFFSDRMLNDAYTDETK